jgi:hypothetical protein
MDGAGPATHAGGATLTVSCMGAVMALREKPAPLRPAGRILRSRGTMNEITVMTATRAGAGDFQVGPLACRMAELFEGDVVAGNLNYNEMPSFRCRSA